MFAHQEKFWRIHKHAAHLLWWVPSKEGSAYCLAWQSPTVTGFSSVLAGSSPTLNMLLLPVSVAK
jgi:hypothetical protein